MVTTIAGTGTAGYLDGDAKTAKFDGPYCITIEKNGIIYVGDNDYLIRKIELR